MIKEKFVWWHRPMNVGYGIKGWITSTLTTRWISTLHMQWEICQRSANRQTHYAKNVNSERKQGPDSRTRVFYYKISRADTYWPM